MEKTNPLGVAQRETSGSDTFAKYLYQYHWALWQMIEKHRKNEEYAVFMEYHENVIFSSSMDGTTVLFEFNQVKNTKRMNLNSVLNIDKISKNSIDLLRK